MSDLSHLNGAEATTLRWLAKKLEEGKRVVLDAEINEYLGTIGAADRRVSIYAVLESFGAVTVWETPLPGILAELYKLGPNPAMQYGSREAIAFEHYHRTRQSGWRIDGKAALLTRQLMQSAPQPEPLKHAATFIPAAVKNWLTARYLTDPTPHPWQRTPDEPPQPIVFVLNSAFTEFLQNLGLDLLPNLDSWQRAGWIEDVRLDVEASENPEDRLPHHFARLGLPTGRHRLVGIRRCLLDAPTAPPSDSTVQAAPTSPGEERSEEGKRNNRIQHCPEWVNGLFRSKQFTLLKALFGKAEVEEQELCALLGYTAAATKQGNLDRRVTETNKNLCERAADIGDRWTIRERTREGVKSYFIERQK